MFKQIRDIISETSLSQGDNEERGKERGREEERGREKQRIVICVVGNEKWNEGRKEEDRKDITK